MIGKVEKPIFLPLHKDIGKATNGTIELDVYISATANTPIVKHPDGRVWSLDWRAIVDMAVKDFDEDSAGAQP